MVSEAKYKTVLIGIVIGLLVGTGTVYVVVGQPTGQIGVNSTTGCGIIRGEPMASGMGCIASR